MNADCLSDKTPVRAQYNRVACGLIGADVRAAWSPRRKTRSGWSKSESSSSRGWAVS